MEIYLIRHTKPLIEKDICYGQMDIPVDETFFLRQARAILNHLPQGIDSIYSSPLLRCSSLASYIQQEKYPAIEIITSVLLKEMNFGEWENKKWNDIDKVQLERWMNNFVNEEVPGGESYIQLYKRSVFIFDQIVEKRISAIVVTHAGVIRSILSYINATVLGDSFTADNVDYGCLVKITRKGKAFSSALIKI